MNTELLKQLGQQEHLTDWELAKKLSKRPDTEYAGVAHDLKELVEAGEAAIIGKKFIDQHGKLFDVYTCHLNAIPERQAAYSLKQKNLQILSLANTLYSEFKEHNTVQSLIDAADLIKQGKGKISLEYHALERSEIVSVYKRVAKDAPLWFAEEKKHYENPGYTSKGTPKKYKIPY